MNDHGCPIKHQCELAAEIEQSEQRFPAVFHVLTSLQMRNYDSLGSSSSANGLESYDRGCSVMLSI